MRQSRQLGRKIPLRYDNAIKVIWTRCGAARFIWRFISAEIPEGPGIATRLKNDGYIQDCGPFMLHSYGNQRTWKLSPEIVRACIETYGPVTDDREQQSETAIQDYRKEIDIRYTPANKKARNNIMVRISEEETDEISALYRIFQQQPFTAKTARESGVFADAGKLRRWSVRGCIEKTIRPAHANNKSKNWWRLTDSQVSSMITNHHLEATT